MESPNNIVVDITANLEYTGTKDELEVITSWALEVVHERIRQNEKWGTQNHDPATWLAILTEETGEVSKEVNEYIFSKTIEARKKAVENMIDELIQVAAVATAYAESLTRNHLSKQVE